MHPSEDHRDGETECKQRDKRAGNRWRQIELRHYDSDKLLQHSGDSPTGRRQPIEVVPLQIREKLDELDRQRVRREASTSYNQPI